MDQVSLSAREQQVLELVVEGLTTRAIAYRLGVSARRVRNLRYSVQRKLEAETMMTAVARAVQLGLVDAWKVG